MSLRFRLNLLVTMLSLGFMVVVGWVLVNETRISIRERVEAANRVTIQLLDTVIISSAMNPSLGPTHYVMQDFLRSLGYVRSSHIELYDHVGNNLYVSPESNFMKSVVPPQWFVNLVSPKVEITQRRIRYGTLVVKSSPEGSVREAWSGFQRLMMIGAGFFVLINLMVYALLSHALRPIRHILLAIKRVEQGDLETKLPHFKLPEFDKIGLSLNRMMDSLGAERKLEENRQLTQLIQKHIEDERRSLARELHDELGQYVTAIKTFAVAIANKSRGNAPEIEASAQTIVAAANQIYDGMHNIIRHLRPSAMDNMGLMETLKDMIGNYQAQHPELKVTLNIQGDFDDLGENININVYRIIQEAINNAIKHADASRIEVTIKPEQNGGMHMLISDDGKGMDMATVDQTNHFGLLGMRERVQALRGDFILQSTNDTRGTTIEIKIPKSLETTTI